MAATFTALEVAVLDQMLNGTHPRARQQYEPKDSPAQREVVALKRSLAAARDSALKAAKDAGQPEPTELRMAFNKRGADRLMDILTHYESANAAMPFLEGALGLVAKITGRELDLPDMTEPETPAKE